MDVMEIEIAEDIAPETAETLRVLIERYHKKHIPGSVKMTVSHSGEYICNECGQKCDSEAYFIENIIEGLDIRNSFVLQCSSCDCGYTRIYNVGAGSTFHFYGSGIASCNFWIGDTMHSVAILSHEASKIMETKLIEIQAVR